MFKIDFIIILFLCFFFFCFRFSLCFFPRRPRGEFRLEQRPARAKEVARHRDDGRAQRNQRPVADARPGTVAHVRGARAMGHLNVVGPGSAVTFLVVVRRIHHVTAIPHNSDVPVNYRKTNGKNGIWYMISEPY